MIRSIGSGAGHALLCGIVENERVAQVADRMMREDLFSGWGIRTLSALHPAYNPFSYHRGSVWPIANADFVFAFARCGLFAEMHKLAKAIFEAASLFAYGRLPELFAGHQRSPNNPFPGIYTKANWPQAWSASAPFKIIQALLGIHPYAPDSLLLLDPHLPEWLPEITVQRMHVANSRVDIRFRRLPEGTTEYEVLDVRGNVRIARRPNLWLLTTGWAEDICEAVSGF